MARLAALVACRYAAYTLWELACQRWRCVSHYIRQGHCTIARQARSYRCSSTLWELACQRWRCVSHFIRQGHCTIARQARSYKCRLHPVGAGLPAMAVSQLFHPARTLRHREASSPPQMPLTPCGSWLASDGGESVISSGEDIAPSRGKLAPTLARSKASAWRIPHA